jgi:hypothetical protein
MLSSTVLLSLLAPLLTLAHPGNRDVNPFLGKNYYANSHYAQELETAKAAFLARNDTLNAARVTTIQRTGTFVWVTSVSGLSNIPSAIAEARAEQRRTRKPQIVELVLYDLPDRDCAAGASAGEFSSADGGLDKYKTLFVDGYARELAKAPDLTFAVVLEPDSLGNVVTNQNIPFCASASPVYEEGIAYAIAKLQFPNVHLYIDAAHGGWLGWADNLPLGKSPPPPPSLTSPAPLLTPRSRRRLLTRRQTSADPATPCPNTRFLHRRLKFQPLHREPARALHRMVALLRRIALRLLARALPRQRLAARPLHHRPGPQRAAKPARHVGRVV